MPESPTPPEGGLPTAGLPAARLSAAPPAGATVPKRFPWGGVTVALCAIAIATFAATTRAFGSHVSGIVLGTLVTLAFATGLVGGSIAAAPAESQRHDGSRTFELRRGLNPFVVGFVGLLVGICPIATAANMLLALAGDSMFTFTAAATLVGATYVAAGTRRRLLDANAVGARWDALFGQRAIWWARTTSVDLDLAARQIVLRDTAGHITRIPIPAMETPRANEFVATLRDLHRAAHDRTAHDHAEDARAALRVDTIGREPRFAPLERSGRSIERWRVDVAALAEREENLREVSIEPDELVCVLGDATANAERRVGAALALAASSDPAIRDRARKAAASETDRRIRVALERACESQVTERTVRRAVEASQRRDRAVRGRS